MNATQANAVRSFSILRIEFEYELQGSYKKISSYLNNLKTYQSEIIVDENEKKSSIDELNSALKNFKSSLLLSFNDLVVFNAGVIRAINGPVFANNNTVVDRLHISDNAVSVQTHPGTKIVVVSMRIKGIDVNTESGDEEFDLIVYEGLGYGFQWRRLAEFSELNQNESTNWFYLGRFPVYNNCPSKSYYLHYDLVERDDAPVVGIAVKLRF